VEEGQKLVAISCGGGGYGDPRARLPEKVREDVAGSLISEARARDVYGVALRPDRSLDEAETQRLRAGL
jgi:N-methylhydantoinase B